MTTINASNNNAIRLTVRVEVGNHKQSADLVIPASSRLAEIIDEIIAITNAPQISSPWQAVTAAGQVVPLGASLAEAHFSHGDVLVLRPKRATPAPVVRDAAECLEDLTTSVNPAVGTANLAAGVGLCGLALVALAFPLPHGLIAPLPLRLATVVLAALAMLIITRRVLFLPIVAIGNGVIGACIVLGRGIVPSWAENTTAVGFAQSWALALLVAAIAISITCVGLKSILTEPLLVTALHTIAIGCVIAAIGTTAYRPGVAVSLMPTWDWVVNAAAALIAVGMIVIALAPTIAIKLARVQIPVLPTAGQDLEVSDVSMAEVPHQAERARKVLDGMLIGLAIVLCPAIMAIGIMAPHSGFSFSLALSMCCALLLHAHRHRVSFNTWAIWLIAMSAAASACAAATWPFIYIHSPALGQSPHPALLIFTIIIVAVSLTSPAWAQRLTTLEPTTVVWIERAELLCIAACLPLALHLVGMFSLLRGIAL